jgi:hypothetical protein
VAGETALDADPRLAKLRQHLDAARGRGLTFAEAWDSGQQIVLDGLAAHERTEWRRALTSTRDAWGRAYAGLPSSRADQLVAWLEAWAEDAERPAMALDDQGAPVVVGPPTLAQRQAVAMSADAAGARY